MLRRPGILGALLIVVVLAGCIEDTPARTGEPGCPGDPTAQAEPDGNVSLSWSAVPGAESYPIVRSGPNASDELIANVSAPSTTYVDANISSQGSYRYTIHAWNGTARSTDCPALEVTTVPFLPSGAAIAAAGVLPISIYLAYRYQGPW